MTQYQICLEMCLNNRVTSLQSLRLHAIYDQKLNLHARRRIHKLVMCHYKFTKLFKNREKLRFDALR